MKGLNTAILIVLHLINGDYIRQSLGRDALESALSNIVELMKSILEASDIVSNIGGSDFGLVLLANDLELVENRKLQLVEAIISQPLLWF